MDNLFYDAMCMNWMAPSNAASKMLNSGGSYAICLNGISMVIEQFIYSIHKLTIAQCIQTYPYDQSEFTIFAVAFDVAIQCCNTFLCDILFILYVLIIIYLYYLFTFCFWLFNLIMTTFSTFLFFFNRLCFIKSSFCGFCCLPNHHFIVW